MEQLKVIILGDGLLGSQLVKTTGWDYLSRKKDNLDIFNIESYSEILGNYDAVINCIAHTDTYSEDREKHWKVNYEFVHSLIQICNKNKQKLIHISTHYIYANSNSNSSEFDVPVHHNSWYGYTKNLGDALVQLLSENYLCIRCMHKPFPFTYNSAWIDQIGNFDYVNLISDQIIRLINIGLSGVYNIGSDLKSIYDLALISNKNVKPSLAPEKAPKLIQVSINKMKKDFQKQPLFSVCIPAYGYNGKGVEFLENNFQKLLTQTLQDFEVIVSDHSVDDFIFTLCEQWKNKLNIKYIRNEFGRGIISPNLNTAMKNANGIWIKILFQDDFLFDQFSLEKQYRFILENSDTSWFATRFVHTNDGINYYRDFIPKWNSNIWTGNNSIGCPSVITLKSQHMLDFDNELNWLMDCDWYFQMYQNYGEPKILQEITVVNRSNNDRLTNNISEEQKNNEFIKLQQKYA